MKAKIRETKKGTAVTVEEISVTLYSDSLLEKLPSEKLLEIVHLYADWIKRIIPFINANEDMMKSLAAKNKLQDDYRFGQRSEKISVVSGKEDAEGGKDTAAPAFPDPPDGPEREEGPKETPETTKKDDRDALKKDEAQEGTTDDPAADLDLPNTGSKEKGQPKRSPGCMDRKYGNLPIHIIHVTYTEEQLKKLYGTSNLTETGEVIARDLAYQPGHLYIREYHIHTYKTPAGKIVRPAKARDVKMGKCSRISAELMAYISEQHFFLMNPYARIEKHLQTYDGHISRQLMIAKSIKYAFELFEPLIQRMWYHLKTSGYIQADETHIRVQKLLKDNPSKKCFMWEFMTSELCLDAPKVVIYHYDESWAYDVVEELLGDYDGHLITDGKDAYQIYGDKHKGKVINCGCLYHFRDKFVKVLKSMTSFKSLSREEKRQIPAYRILVMLAWIFHIDGLAELGEPQKRLVLRKGAVSIMFDEMMEYIHSLNEEDFEDGKYMHEALVYARNQEQYLREFLNDPYVPNNNSAAERNHVRFANLRNNIKMINSIDGAIATADSFSIVSTARENGANIYYYFLYLYQKLPSALKDIPKGTYETAEELDRFMPWSEEYRAYEKEQLRLHGEMVTENRILSDTVEYIHPTLD